MNFEFSSLNTEYPEIVRFPDFKLMVICDLDYTLVNLNTTNELLKIVNLRKFKILFRLLVPFSILGTIFKRDFTKQMLVKSILGRISKSHLESLSLLFYEKVKRSSKINLGLLSIIRSLERFGPVILLTASLDIIANKFKELGFTYVISSPTSYRDEKLVGFYDLYRRKYEVIRSILSRNIFRKIIIFDDTPEPEMRTLCSRNKDICILIDRIR